MAQYHLPIAILNQCIDMYCRSQIYICMCGCMYVCACVHNPHTWLRSQGSPLAKLLLVTIPEILFMPYVDINFFSRWHSSGHRKRMMSVVVAELTQKYGTQYVTSHTENLWEEVPQCPPMLPPIMMSVTVCPRLTEVSNFIATLAQRGSIVVMITVVMVNLLNI